MDNLATVIIDPKKWYTLTEVINGGYLPYKTFHSFRTIVLKDKGALKILKPIITGSKRGTKYRIKGQHIINFINKY